MNEYPVLWVEMFFSVAEIAKYNNYNQRSLLITRYSLNCVSVRPFVAINPLS